MYYSITVFYLLCLVLAPAKEVRSLTLLFSNFFLVFSTFFGGCSVTFFIQKNGNISFSLGPMGNLSNITLHPRDSNKHPKRGKKISFEKTFYILEIGQNKIFGHWDF